MKAVRDLRGETVCRGTRSEEGFPGFGKRRDVFFERGLEGLDALSGIRGDRGGDVGGDGAKNFFEGADDGVVFFEAFFEDLCFFCEVDFFGGDRFGVGCAASFEKHFNFVFAVAVENGALFEGGGGHRGDRSGSLAGGGRRPCRFGRASCGRASFSEAAAK